MSDEITQALQKARFNDLVHINIHETDDQESREIILQACLDQENGGIQWTPIPDNISATKLHLSTKRWFFPMLNDKVRNQAYDKAIQLACEDVVRQFDPKTKEDDIPRSIHGLDIGSGTGLLAMLSAKHLKSHSSKSPAKSPRIRIESLEMSTGMAQIARKTVSSNQFDSSVQISARHSCEMDSLFPKAQLCTSELLESGLLAEGWLPAMRDAWKRHLDPSAIVVPQRAKVWAQIVEGESLASFWGPHQSVEGGFVDNKVLKLWFTEGITRNYLLHASGTGAGVQVDVHAKEFIASKKHPLMMLSDPIAILDIDVTSLEAMPPEGGQSKTRAFVPTTSGTAHAVLFWWELDLYKGKVLYTTHHDQPFQDHWQQCLYIFTRQDSELQRLRKGEPSLLKGSHSDAKLKFEIIDSIKRNDGVSNNRLDSKRLKTTPPEASNIISSDRAWQLNDLERINVFKKGIMFAMNKIGLEQVIAIDLSDFSLGGMTASLLGCPLVFSVEGSSNAIPLTAAKIAQISNGLPLRQDNNHDFQVLQCHPEQINSAVLKGKVPNLVVAEPYYEILEGWHMQEALNYFYIVSALKRREVLEDSFLSVPARATVMVCAFQSNDIGSAYCNCEMELCGFAHDSINAESPLYDHEIQIPSWQYDIQTLTEPMAVARIDFQAGKIVEEASGIEVKFETSGTCHGIIMWIEYHVTLGENKTDVVSTIGRGHQQIVQMLLSPMHISSHQVENGTVRLRCKSLMQAVGRKSSFVDFEIIVLD